MPIDIFISYAHEDEDLRDQLATHLAPLAGIATSWHDRSIGAGTDWAGEIDARLQTADIILLLVSADFIASHYCTQVEVPQALARYESGATLVIPVILRACHWTGLPYGKLQAVPKNAHPITLWPDRDKAWYDVVAGIRAAVAKIAAGEPHGAGAATNTQPTPAPPPATQFAAAARIPDFLVVDFVARRDNDGNDIVARLQLELAPQQRRLVVLWGAGGVGKTTLAAEAARALLADFNGRVVWTSALGRADYTRATLLDEIATQLGHPDVRQLAADPKAEAVNALLTQTPALVVLDNFETVSEAEQKHCVAFLNATRCPALITTRQKVDGARNVPIAAMSLIEARDYLQLLAKQTSDPSVFAQLDRDRIINTAERNPLLLQWIVGQIEAAQDPATVLADLTHGAGDAAERVFARSFNLPQLTDDGRAALLALSLFTPDASRAALAEVAAFGTDAIRLSAAVKQLAALWLVKTTDAGKRLALEALTRQLALARLQKDTQADEYLRRYVAYFMQLAEAHAQPTPEDLGTLDAERDNLLHAIDVAFELKDWKGGLGLVDVLLNPNRNWLLGVRGYWEEAIRRGEQAVEAAQAAHNGWAAATFASNTAAIRMQRGEYGAARQAYEKGLAVFRTLGGDEAIAACLHQLAILAQAQGELGEARRLYDESLEIEKKLGNKRGIASTLHELGRLAQAQGELDEARRLYNESLEIKQKLGDQRGIAITLHQLGTIAYLQGELGEARRLYDESLEIEKKAGNQSGIASTLHSLALIAQAQGELDEARRLYNESLEIKQKLGDQRGIANTTSQLGVVHFLLGEFAESKAKHEESLMIRRKLGDQQGIAIDLHQLGLLAEEEGDRAEAARLLREALSIFERLKSPYAEMAREHLARVEADGE